MRATETMLTGLRTASTAIAFALALALLLILVPIGALLNLATFVDSGS